MLKVSGLSEFNKAIEEYSKKVSESPQKIAKMIMLEIQRDTILKTPFDTGRLVNGWNISISPSPTFNSIGSMFSTSEQSAKQNLINSNSSKINSFNGGIIWFANNVEYAKYNEFGTNKITGKLMLTKAIQKNKTRINQLAKEAIK